MIIYKATNKTNGKSYIGQTVRTLAERRREHLNSAGNLGRTTRPIALHVAISKHGSGNFSWEVLEECATQAQLDVREKFYIKLLKTLAPDGYNGTSGGVGMNSDMADRVREKIATKMRLLHQDPLYRSNLYPKLKGLVPPNKGKPMTEEQKTKLSIMKLALYSNPSYVNPNVGQKRTPEQIERIKRGQEGKILSGENHPLYGRPVSDSTRAKMRAAKLGKKPVNTDLIICLQTNEVFEGLTEAAKALKVQRQSIWLNLKGKLKIVGGKYTFERLMRGGKGRFSEEG
jgi:group I intron endonuclease